MKKYNGWTNYETLIVAVWIDNEERWMNDVIELVKLDYEYDFERHNALKDYVEELVFAPVKESTLGNDLIGCALDNVNWKEIVDSKKEGLCCLHWCSQ